MERKFHVVFTGRLHAGFNREDTALKMALLFRLDRQKVGKLLSSGRPTIMKQGLSWEQAQKFKDHLERIGLQMKIFETEICSPRVANAISPSPSADPAPGNRTPVPKALETVVPPAPAEVTQPTAAQENSTNSPGKEKRPDNIVPPFRVESSHGWLWIKEAFGMFFMQPLTWTAMMLLALVIIIIPFAFNLYLGCLFVAVVTPIFHGGLMLGAQNQKEGRRLQITHLFLGFRYNLPQLLLGSLFPLLALITEAAITVLCIGKIVAAGTNPAIPEVVTVLIREFPLHLAGLSIAVAFTIPVMMGYWFTPCLAALDNRTAFAGFRLSFRAVMMNSVAFFMYALVLLLLGLFFIFLFGALAALFSFLLGSGHIFLFMFLPLLTMILLGIPLATIVPLSIYTGYRDIFHGREKETGNL
jgi:hypothetical protein